MAKSKSKTFPKGTDMGEVADWFYEQVNTTDEEVVYPGAEPSMTFETRTDAKYLITITKLPEKGEKGE